MKTNYDMIHNMSLPELAAWVAVQINKYYLADNTVISDDETEQIAHKYVEWMMEEQC